MRLLLLMLPLGLFAEITTTDSYTVSCKVEHIDVREFNDGKVEIYGSFTDGLKKGDTVLIDIELVEAQWKKDNLYIDDWVELHLSTRDDPSSRLFLGELIGSSFEKHTRNDYTFVKSGENQRFSFKEITLYDYGKILVNSPALERKYRINRYYKDDYQFFYNFYGQNVQASYYLNCLNAKGLTISIDKFFKYIENQD